MFLKGKKIKVVFSLLTVICLMFGLSTSAFAAFTIPSVKYSIEKRGFFEYEIPFELKNTPSINVITEPSKTSNNNLNIQLFYSKDRKTWGTNSVAKSNNSGQNKDTCALNPQNTGKGYYKIRIDVSVDYESNEGTLTITDWNNG
ncbi:hypothetical protein [Paenibacillus alvei]|uniref:hypothetical protein n=1 Tax=Paenibacillus alvei TaxID=44250 RepID=UPI0018CF3B49|nr:hypothetical protein [Paenibacillus alvei]MBG9735780.1 hypothetical protein [Paenibacillus alvei]MBG9744361.1 hypothetical protein [Paenibacillus alvei]MCY9577902.1 hypothetical protein [Paenibacillus alvei]MCY9587331.1 hypothetical protein [Paenibacillus alvei]